MKKQYILIVLVLLYCLNSSYAQCDTAVAIVDEGFESYTSGGSLANANTCWTALDNNSLSTYIGIRDTGANTGSKCISAYTFFGEDSVLYYVSPKLNSINGTHLADFYVNASNAATLEMGTMSDPNDISTFTSVSGVSNIPTTYTKFSSGIVASTSDEYFVVKISAPSNHTSIKFDDFKWQSVCETPVATLDDDFAAYTAGTGNPMPRCWNAIGAVAAGIRTGGVSDSNCIMTYDSTVGDMYIVAPKLNTINGNYQADFKIKANNSTATYQVGTMSDNINMNTFTSLGSSTAIINSFVQVNTGDIAASANEYFVIKITTNQPHTSVRIDEFKWNVPSVLSTNTFISDEFGMYPNPSENKQVIVQMNSSTLNKVSVFDLKGRQVYTATYRGKTANLNLSSLISGMYFVNVTDQNNNTVTKKLILK
ncbi:MAG: hypothetical protein COA88_02880 [Kordia sp.]|nr:MAG: hypothetical protein COA88_02880 [Kordia sp.]